MTIALPHEWRRPPYLISTDRGRIDFAAVHAFLTASYWSPGIAQEAVERAAAHSMPFGLYHEPGSGEPGSQVGYARVLTDHVALAYVLDVFILPEHRRQGLARWLMETILGHPDLQSIRVWQLKTRDAHRLYAGLGFEPPPDPERFMRRVGAA